jgi:uncharacterized protein
MPDLTLTRARRRRVLLPGLLAGGVAALVAAPASAHVSVAADDAHRGSPDTVLTFRVPNERDNATTVKVDIKFPARTPLASVKPAPKPGWALTVTKVTFSPPITTDDGTLTEGVGEIVYTASSPSTGIPVDGFESFEVLVGPLPETGDALAFPTVQTYSNGQVSSWIEPVTDPAQEPEHPAPTLKLLAADEGTGPSVSSQPAAPAAPVDSAAYASKSEVSTGRTIGIVGVVTGALGLLLGGLALGRARSAG